MENFYASWLGNMERGGGPMSKAQAVMAARQFLRDYIDPLGGKPYEHPYYWSAFVIAGDRN